MIVHHARSLLPYLLEGEKPIRSGDWVDGVLDGTICPDVQWRVQYEDSLLRPIREVLDVHTGDYASGQR